jgi:phosphoenolpyruvate carboxykinase (GTP)
MNDEMNAKMKGCMVGRTMYVVPFCLGPLTSPYSKIGIEITDSAYVVVGLKTLTRMGQPVWARLNTTTDWMPCLHSVGAPLKPGKSDSSWPCNPNEAVVAHFLDKADRKIVSYGSGFGTAAILSKHAFGLRLASVLAQEEGWHAEHGVILGVTSPQGEIILTFRREIPPSGHLPRWMRQNSPCLHDSNNPWLVHSLVGISGLTRRETMSPGSTSPKVAS